MPPKKKEKVFTLNDALKYFDTLANAPASLRNWKDSLITLVHYVEAGDSAFPTMMTKKELGETYKDVNIYPIITDFKKVEDLVDNKIMSSRSNQPIAIDSKKQYALSIIRLTQKKSPCQIPKPVRELYNDKLKEIEQSSNQLRNLNTAKRGNAKYPEFDWTTALKEYDEFITSKAFSNTVKGKKDLRDACLVGLYVLQRPRRIQDYTTLQFYSKKPNDKEADGRNIVYADGDKMFFSIDMFKTRFRVSGNATAKKELLPRYVKELDSKLSSLLKDYIKKAQVKDMSKLTSEERRNKRNFFVFYKESGTSADGYDEGSFSKVLSQSMKRVFNGRTALSVNTLRHMFNSWIAENLNQFNDSQLQQIAIDVGDTPKQLPTNLRYRIQHAENIDVDKTEIQGNIAENDFIREMVEREGEEEGSVGNVAEQDEVVSPAPPMVVDGDIDILYTKLGRAVMEVKNIEFMIAKKLGM